YGHGNLNTSTFGRPQPFTVALRARSRRWERAHSRARRQTVRPPPEPLEDRTPLRTRPSGTPRPTASTARGHTTGTGRLGGGALGVARFTAPVRPSVAEPERPRGLTANTRPCTEVRR